MDLSVACMFLLMCLKCLFQGVSAVRKENIYASGCNDDELNLECESNHKIAIKRVYYGAKLDKNCVKKGVRWAAGCCERRGGKETDCIVPDNDIYTTMNIQCSGYQTCSVDVKKIRTRGRCSDKTIKYTTYMTVIYSCIPVTEIAQFCNNEIKRAPQLYLSNKNYPKPIEGGGKYCQCLVETHSAGLTVNIVDIMITMPEKTNVCPQQLHIMDKSNLEQTSVTCGQSGMFGYRPLYERMVSNLTLVLDSKSKDSRGYIWVHIKAKRPEDYVEIYCGDARDQHLYGNVTVTRTNLPATQTPTKVNPNINGTAVGELKETHIIPDMIAIIGGIAGAVAVILIVCIVAIAVHCTRESERSSYPKIPEVIPSPMVRGKVYHPEDKNATHNKYNYDEDRYCSIKRSPMKLTNMSEVDDEADKKLKEAFLQGPEEFDPPPPVNRVNCVKVNGVPPRPRSPELPLKDDPLPPYPDLNEDQKSPEKYFTMNPQKPESELAEIRVTSSLPQRGQKNKKVKTVTFSPVALVTPLPSGSEESIGSEGDRNLANIIDSYQSLHDEDFSSQKPLILPPPNETGGFASIQGPNADEIAEMEVLWNNLGNASCSTTMDEGAYDNIDYLLAQNRARHEHEV